MILQRGVQEVDIRRTSLSAGSNSLSDACACILVGIELTSITNSLDKDISIAMRLEREHSTDCGQGLIES